MMPVLFVGHGSPMNIIEENQFTKGWKDISEKIPTPNAILCISAHWYVDANIVSATAVPETIHDFFGFPPELYGIEYKTLGAPQLAQRVSQILTSISVDKQRGLDHGAWSVLRLMYPNAGIPVCQLSVNSALSPMESYNIGKALRTLRDEGVLIVGSGNIVHNLSLINWEMEGGYPWADAFDLFVMNAIKENRHEDIIEYDKEPSSRYAFFYRDHFDPLLYSLGAAEGYDSVEVFNAERVLGSVSMTSYLFK